MIIVEGADNCGKSTLIKQLLGLDPTLRVMHRDKFKPEQGETIGTSYVNVLLPPDGFWLRHVNGIADRFFASECIYGSLYRNGCRMSEREHHLILTMLKGMCTIVIHCDPGDDAILATWSEREQLYDREPLTLSATYRARLPTIFRGLPIIRYDYTHHLADVHRAHIVDAHGAALRGLDGIQRYLNNGLVL